MSTSDVDEGLAVDEADESMSEACILTMSSVLLGETI